MPRIGGIHIIDYVVIKEIISNITHIRTVDHHTPGYSCRPMQRSLKMARNETPQVKPRLRNSLTSLKP
jgi:hypothetical protein